MMSEKNRLIILTGPTAVGKTSLSIKLAKKLDGEIISADSMQVYKHMDIGSAKIRDDEMMGVRHHLIDILEPNEEFNVFKFKEYTKKALDDIYSRGRIPIMAGGTGFYIQSVLYDIDFKDEDEERSSDIREKYEKLADSDPDLLYERLREVDPKSCESIHKNNIKRVIRALSYYELNGKKISEHNEEERNKSSSYDHMYFVLNDDRKKIYDNIDKRVDIMINEGLVAEVKSLMDMGVKKGATSMQGLGYKEIYAYLSGQYDLERAVYLIKRDTRHFAKRQLTWFKRERDVIMIDRSSYKDEDDILSDMMRMINEHYR